MAKLFSSLWGKFQNPAIFTSYYFRRRGQGLKNFSHDFTPQNNGREITSWHLMRRKYQNNHHKTSRCNGMNIASLVFLQNDCAFLVPLQEIIHTALRLWVWVVVRPAKKVEQLLVLFFDLSVIMETLVTQCSESANLADTKYQGNLI